MGALSLSDPDSPVYTISQALLVLTLTVTLRISDPVLISERGLQPGIPRVFPQTIFHGCLPFRESRVGCGPKSFPKEAGFQVSLPLVGHSPPFPPQLPHFLVLDWGAERAIRQEGASCGLSSSLPNSRVSLPQPQPTGVELNPKSFIQTQTTREEPRWRGVGTSPGPRAKKV